MTTRDILDMARRLRDDAETWSREVAPSVLANQREAADYLEQLERGVNMNDVTNAKGTIADKIHQAVNSLLETEMRLNRELGEARKLVEYQEGQISGLQSQLRSEQETRHHLEEIVRKVAELVR